MYLKIETSLVGKPHNLLQDKPNRLDEERIDKRVNDFAVLVSRMLFEDDLILHKKVRHVVIQIDVL
jgi:hypothetical protein